MKAHTYEGGAVQVHQWSLIAAMQNRDRRAARRARMGLMVATWYQARAMLRQRPGHYGTAPEVPSGIPCSMIPANKALPSGSTSSLKS